MKYETQGAEALFVSYLQLTVMVESVNRLCLLFIVESNMNLTNQTVI